MRVESSVTSISWIPSEAIKGMIKMPDLPGRGLTPQPRGGRSHLLSSLLFEVFQMSMILARHFGHPRGVLGRLVGRMMARFNGDFNRWVVQQVKEQRHDQPARFVELGPGPGIGLEAALDAFPAARVWGVDPSPEMISQSRRRNRESADSGRLTLIKGELGSLAGLAPIDVVMANHVLYFWHDPTAELARLRAALGTGGILALGYQLRQNMPKQARTNFPKEGHLLYDSEDAVASLLREAGFTTVRTLTKGPADAPDGRLAIATV